MTHRARVEAMLAAAADRHAALLPELPPRVRDSLPVDAAPALRAAYAAQEQAVVVIADRLDG